VRNTILQAMAETLNPARPRNAQTHHNQAVLLPVIMGRAIRPHLGEKPAMARAAPSASLVVATAFLTVPSVAPDAMPAAAVRRSSKADSQHDRGLTTLRPAPASAAAADSVLRSVGR